VPEEQPVVAAFDLDGTLTTRDCVVPFLRYVAGTGGLAAGFVRRAPLLVAALARGDRDRLKELATDAAFTGRSLAGVEAAGESFATGIAAAWFRPDTVEILSRHHADGHHIVVVSASYAVYLRPLVARVGVVDAIGTELAVDEAGRCTGALDGGNCRGVAKVVRLHRLLGQRFGGRDNVTLWAYGDSRGDEAMLADADHPVWVRR
jgi:phosphatidylglycerophosphatase C